MTTTRSPASKLCAPQTMPWGSPVPLASPTSTVHQLIVFPFFCGSWIERQHAADDERAGHTTGVQALLLEPDG